MSKYILIRPEIVNVLSKEYLGKEFSKQNSLELDCKALKMIGLFGIHRSRDQIREVVEVWKHLIMWVIEEFWIYKTLLENSFEVEKLHNLTYLSKGSLWLSAMNSL